MRTQILNTAAQHYIDRGFKTTTIQETAKQITISKKTLYLLFKNKNSIITQVADLLYSKNVANIAVHKQHNALKSKHYNFTLQHIIKSDVVSKALFLLKKCDPATLPSSLLNYHLRSVVTTKKKERLNQNTYTKTQ